MTTPSPSAGLTEEHIDELLDQLVHCVRYSERNPHDWYARDEVMIARRLVKDAAQEPKGDGWRPIETAPRDGSAVLLCWAIDADGDPIDWNNEPTTAGVFVQVASWSEIEGRWWVYISTPSDAALHFNPTHWRPLPAPPNTREGEG